MTIIKTIVTVIASMIMMLVMIFCTDSGSTWEILGRMAVVLAVFGVFFWVLWRSELYDVFYGRSAKEIIVRILKFAASVILSLVLLLGFGAIGNPTSVIIFNIVSLLIYSGLMFLIWNKEIRAALKSDKSPVIKQVFIGIAIVILLFCLPNFCSYNNSYYLYEEYEGK